MTTPLPQSCHHGLFIIFYGVTLAGLLMFRKQSSSGVYCLAISVTSPAGLRGTSITEVYQMLDIVAKPAVLYDSIMYVICDTIPPYSLMQQFWWILWRNSVDLRVHACDRELPPRYFNFLGPQHLNVHVTFVSCTQQKRQVYPLLLTGVLLMEVQIQSEKESVGVYRSHRLRSPSNVMNSP